MVKKILARSYLYLILLIMYLPILVLIAFAFSSNDVISFTGNYNFSFDLFKNLFSNTKVANQIWTAVGNTLIIAVVSSLISLVLGTLGAIGTFYLSNKKKKVVEFATQIPIANAEIVIALSLTVMFVFLGTYIFKAKLFSFWTLLIGHVVLSIPFVYLNVKPKLTQMDPHIYEAALDLGATPNKALMKAVVPQIASGMFSGFLLSMTLSLDDYIVTEFTRGAGLLSGDAAIETLSTFIQTSLKKHAVPAELRPLTLFIFIIVLGGVLAISLYKYRKDKKGVRKDA